VTLLCLLNACDDQKYGSRVTLLCLHTACDWPKNMVSYVLAWNFVRIQYPKEYGTSRENDQKIVSYVLAWPYLTRVCDYQNIRNSFSSATGRCLCEPLMKSNTISLVEAEKDWFRHRRNTQPRRQASVTYFGLIDLLTVGVSTDVWGSYSTMRRKRW
jgi:hypothetical protein